MPAATGGSTKPIEIHMFPCLQAVSYTHLTLPTKA